MKLVYCIKRKLAKRLNPFPKLSKRVFELNDLAALKQVMGWELDPIPGGDDLLNYRNELDANFRPLRDAEVVGVCCRNVAKNIALEIGTAGGRMTAIMAENAPTATIHTVNIPPEEIDAGGTFTTYAPGRDEIGKYYREKGLTNVEQILANTANWSPDFGPIEVAFIDGSHDWDFVYHDTRKVLEKAQPGSVICWHDFDLSRTLKHKWMGDVAWGVEMLCRKGLVRGPIFHVKDSWVGVYRVPQSK